MAPLSTTASLLRRLGDPDRPVPAVVTMVAGSLLLFAAVLVALPSPAEGSHGQVIDVPAVTTTSSLLDGPTRVVVPEPSDGSHEARVIVNHRAADVEVTAQLANGEGLAVELSDAGPRATGVRVASTAVHVCGRYAGSLILEATHPDLPGDLLVLDVRFAECDESEPLAMAPDTVNDVEPTWAEEGRPPWEPVPVAPTPSPTEPTPTESDTATESPSPEATEERTRDPEPSPDEPTRTPKPDPTTEPEPTPSSEPTPDPTPTTEPSPEPSPTSEPTRSPSPTSEPTSDPSPTSTSTEGGSSDGGAASPNPTTTATGGQD